MSEHYLYIKIISSYPALFRNVQKNLMFLNNNLGNQTNAQLYVEDLQDGLLYVYKNYDLFVMLNNPLSPAALKKLQQSSREGAHFFMEKVMIKSQFPAAGVSLSFTITGEAIRQACALYHTYFQSYRDQNIVVKQMDDETVIVEFLRFESLELYAQRLSRFLEVFM